MQAQRPLTEKAVAAIQHQWPQVQINRNRDVLALLLVDNFVKMGSGGKVTVKAETPAIVKATKFTAAEYFDLKVMGSGDTAIATGSFKGKGIDGPGRSYSTDKPWTDTSIKMPARNWQCVASHGSP